MLFGAVQFSVWAGWLQSGLEAQEWARFRGVNGSGVSSAEGLPIRWNESENLAWKLELPGEGSSSPVVWEDRIFVTCSEAGAARGGFPRRSLLCVDAVKGSLLWSMEAPEPTREDPAQGYLTEHGYASNSAATDGRAVYAFFGKSGVVACDMDGRKLWQVSVGSESSNRQWGSASSVTLFEELVIINAAEEGRAVLALHRDDGRVVWKAEAAALELAYGTPAQLKYDDGRTELILAVPGEVWGLNARTGKLAWFAETQLTGNVCPSPLVVGSDIFLFGGFRSSGSYCLRSGGKGDVTQTHVKWQTRSSSYVATPVHFNGRLYWADDQGIAWCLKLETGETVYRERIPELRSGGRPIYASPIVAGGRIYIPTRRDGTLVIPADDNFSVLAMNRIAGDESDFNATAAVHGKRLILRSNRAIYAVGAGGQ
jgi:outer membrane protein assembly factor BamB